MSQDRQAQLDEIADEIRHLASSPLYAYRQENDYQPVIGEGDSQADVLFIGEAPGKQEAQSGRPFVGPSGRLLDQFLDEIDLDRGEVYITNVVKDRPPENRDPRKAEIELYRPFLMRQIEIIQPRVIVPLGRFAMNVVLERFGLDQKGQKISDLHGQVLEAEAAYGEIYVVPLFHPAAALYTRSRESALRGDFQILKNLLEKTRLI